MTILESARARKRKENAKLRKSKWDKGDSLDFEEGIRRERQEGFTESSTVKGWRPCISDEDLGKEGFLIFENLEVEHSRDRSGE